MRILHIEDDLSNARLVEMYVNSTIHEIMSVSTIQAAYSALDFQPDMILLDMILEGGRDGFQFVSELRQHGYTMPVIAVTALSAHNDMQACYEAGVDRVLVKPFTIKQLAQVIHAYAEVV